MSKKIVFSPVTRLSGLLSVEVIVDKTRIVEANASSTMFRGFEWIMRDRHVTDAVYMTQRVCGICSLAHGAVASYLLDEIYNNEISENAQYLRNVMLGADFLQNHIRHFYLFSMPDFVRMPDRPPFHGQDKVDLRLNPKDNERLVNNYFEAVKAAQKCHQILALFGGKAPHQHSFVHGGVAVAPTADIVNSAKSLIREVGEFVKGCMIPDTELIAKAYSDYFKIGRTSGNFLSFGLFKFGSHNEKLLWREGVLENNSLSIPNLELITEDITNSWFKEATGQNNEGNPGKQVQSSLEPAPQKPGAYTFVKSVLYNGKHFEGGPLARMIITGKYKGSTSTMDRIYARTLETGLIVDLVAEWLQKLVPSAPPLVQKEQILKDTATATTDAMRGTLMHSVKIENEEVAKYNIIPPTVWNFSPKDKYGRRGPVESALVGLEIPTSEMLFTILGRIVRSFDPCMACGTHVVEIKKLNSQERINNVYGEI